LFWIADLHRLRRLGRPEAPPPHRVEVVLRDRAAAREPRGEQVGGGDRVLDREVDADASDRRHRVRRVADAEEARLAPVEQPVDGDGEELDVAPRAHVADVRGEHRRGRDHLRAEDLDRLALQRLGAALGNDERRTASSRRGRA
jgi:hypothetical protein